MSDENMSTIQAQLLEQRYEIETLKNSHGELISTLKETTKSMNDLAQSFAVSAQKHDDSAASINELKKDVKELRDFKSAVTPFIEGARAVMWKFFWANLAAIGACSAIVASISKMS